MPADRLEALYVGRAMRSRQQHSYAVSGENRFWQLGRLRRAFIAASIVVASACSVYAGIQAGEALQLRREAQIIDAQIVQLSETYRLENEGAGSVQADSYEMKLAVDTGEFILHQRVPVPWVMQQLGAVLSEYPDVRVQRIAWETESSLPVLRQFFEEEGLRSEVGRACGWAVERMTGEKMPPVPAFRPVAQGFFLEPLED